MVAHSAQVAHDLLPSAAVQRGTSRTTKMISIVSIGVALAAMTGCASDPSDVPAAAAATAPEASAPAAVLPVARPLPPAPRAANRWRDY